MEINNTFSSDDLQLKGFSASCWHCIRNPDSSTKDDLQQLPLMTRTRVTDAIQLHQTFCDKKKPFSFMQKCIMGVL